MKKTWSLLSLVGYVVAGLIFTGCSTDSSSDSESLSSTFASTMEAWVTGSTSEVTDGYLEQIDFTQYESKIDSKLYNDLSSKIQLTHDLDFNEAQRELTQYFDYFSKGAKIDYANFTSLQDVKFKPEYIQEAYPTLIVHLVDARDGYPEYKELIDPLLIAIEWIYQESTTQQVIAAPGK